MTYEHVGGECLAAKFPGNHVTSKRRVPPNKAHQLRLRSCIMADYWKSQPRKFCEACKCWFGDNRASIDFHERGKRHKDNVQRQLREARINATDKEKEKAKTANTLQAIEKAAMKAYQRDLEIKVGLPLSQEASLIHLDESPQLKEELVPGHKQIHVDFSAFQTSTPPPSTTTVTPPSPPVAPPPPPSQWEQLTSPEGYWYYHNVLTGVSQWEPPPEFQQPQQEQQHDGAETSSTAAVNSVTTTTEGTSTDTDTAAVTTEGGGHKRSADEAQLEERGVYQRPKIVERPYGQWTTVVLRPQEPEEDKEEGVEKNSEKDRDKGGSDSSDNEDRDQSDKRVKYFQEKTLPSSSETVASGSFKGFGFKKRPGGGGAQKRPQIRQRTSDL